MSIWGKITDKVKHVVNDAGDKIKDTAEGLSTGEAESIVHAISSTGVSVGKGFLSGAEQAGEIFSDPEKVGNGLVAAGRYASQHSCDIAIGSALSAAVVAVALDGEEEGTAGALAITVGSLEAAGENLVESIVLKTASMAFAKLVTDAVWAIPGVSDAPFSKDMFTKALTFAVFKAVSEKPELVISTGGQYIIGVAIAAITQMVCEGTAPGGFTVWEGAQGSLFDKLTG